VSPVSKIKRARFTPNRGSGDLGRPRVALCAVFAIHGFIYASWAVRVPAVKQQAQASESGLRAGLTTLSFLALAAAAIA
jgi:hypothetical protein